MEIAKEDLLKGNPVKKNICEMARKVVDDEQICDKLLYSL